MNHRHVPLMVVFLTPILLVAAGKPKGTPAKVGSDLMVIANQVVEEQWPATLKLVNAPAYVDHVEPGQCIRFAVFATEDDRDRLLTSTKVDLQVTVDGKTQSFPAELPASVKEGKPEGGDFVTQALSAANVKNPMLSMVSFAVSSAKWCAPRDTSDGSFSVTGSALLPDGKTVRLKSLTLPVTTFATARQKFPLDTKHSEEWLQRYYEAPTPSRILLAMRSFATDQHARQMANVRIFFVEALRNDPVASDELKHALMSEERPVRLYGTSTLRLAGAPIDDLLDGLTSDERAELQSTRLPDPYDLTPDPNLANRMDMLWSIFFATGRRKPVETVASMLAWHSDYDSLQKKLSAGEKPSEITPEVMRGACYSAAGWSLNGLSLSSPLVADYIEAIQASPDTAAAIRKELAALTTNPAFEKK